MTTELNLDKILAAERFSDLFSSDSRKELRRALKATHPDLHPGNEEKAHEAFVKVNMLWKLKSSEGVEVKNVSTMRSDVLYSKKHEYSQLVLRRKANGVSHYIAVRDGSETVTVSIATHPKVGGFLLDGVRAVREAKSRMPESYREFFPNVIDAFHLVQDGVKLSGIAQQVEDSFYSLREVNEDYPEGVHGRDSAWMFRRMLVAVGNLHDYGYAHGGISLDSFLIEPETHRLLLQDFQYVNELGSDSRMVNSFSKPYYSEERSVSVDKDLRMLSSLMMEITAASLTPKRLMTFYRSASKFPASTASEMLGDYDYVLKEVYGDRKFHEFNMRR